MASFTATQPFSGSTYATTEIYTFSTSSNYTVTLPWYARAYTNPMPVRILRGAQVKVWSGTTWTLAPPS